MRIILQGVVGSTAYGLATSGSDVDLLGIYLAPTRSMLGLKSDQFKTVVTTSPDSTHHEVAKFLSLALKSNPTILELLWLPSYSILTPAGQRILDLRRDVLSTPYVQSAYGGYAMGQAQRLLTRAQENKSGFDAGASNRTAKHARHCLRLLISGEELLTTGELSVDVSNQRQLLFDAGDQAVKDPQAFHDMFKRRLQRFNNLSSVLPSAPNFDRVNSTLIELRLDELGVK